MDFSELYSEFEEAKEKRKIYEREVDRAENILITLRRIFRCECIKAYEIIVSISREEIGCKNPEHIEHALTINGLEIIHKHSDGKWDHCEHNINPIDMLKLICSKINELIKALREFQREEDERNKEIKEFLDRIEGALKPIVLAEKLAKK